MSKRESATYVTLFKKKNNYWDITGLQQHWETHVKTQWRILNFYGEGAKKIQNIN
jgi:hypothetical protein